MNFISDTLFSTVTANRRIFEFPNARENRSKNIPDLIQPNLGQLQPNLDEFMDTIEPLQDLFSPPKLPPVPEECQMQSESTNNLYNQSYGNVSTCYQTNQHSLSLHSELHQLKMTNMRQEATDSSCPLHVNNYSTEDNYQSNFSTMFHQSSNGGDYQSSNHSYNSIPPGNSQTHHNELQLPPPPPAYPFEFNTSNVGHESVISSNNYNQHPDMSAVNNSVMTYGNGSSTNDFKNRNPQVQTYSKFPQVVRNSQDHFVTPKIRQKSRNRQTQLKQKVMPSNINSSSDNNQSVLLAQLLSSNNMFSTPSSTGVSNNMTKFRNTNGSYQSSYQQVPQGPQISQIPYQLIQRRARTPDHVLTSYTDHLVYRKPSPVFMNQSDCNVYNLTPNTRGLLDAVGTPGGIHQLPQIQPRFDIPHGNTQGYSTYRLPQTQEYINHHPVMDKPSPPSNQPSPTNNYSQPLITPIPQSLSISTSPMTCSTDLCQKTHSPNQTNESINLSQRNGSMSMPAHVMIPGPSRTPYKVEICAGA
uniref:MLX-interacting protein n=1 Tax=Sipha flava TaxID=143950 RepID=A0A2S2Q9W8_9HEMI